MVYKRLLWNNGSSTEDKNFVGVSPNLTSISMLEKGKPILSAPKGADISLFYISVFSFSLSIYYKSNHA